MSMAKTSVPYHNETTPSSFNGLQHGKNENSIPDRYSAVLKHNPGISCEWSAEEQAVLDEGLMKFASESNMNRYAKISIQLPNKTVRDVALRCRWMSKKENGKRKKEELLAKKIKDKKEKMHDISGRQLPFASHSKASSSAISQFPSDCEDASYNAIGGVTRELLEQNALAFRRISSNLSALQIEENIDLLRRTRENILQILSYLNEASETMRQMPPLRERLNEELAIRILPPSHLML